MNLECPTKLPTWAVLRVKAGSVARVTLLSGDWLHLWMHFYRRSFLCCESDDCALCDVLPARPYWYLPALSATTRALTLLELSATSSADLEQRAKFLGFSVAAGLEVELSRKSAKRPLRIEAVAQSPAAREVALQTWVSGLMRIYGLPLMHDAETLFAYSSRILPLLRERSKVAADRVRNANVSHVRNR